MTSRPLIPTLLAFLCGAAPAFAAGGHGGHDELPLHAETIFHLGPLPITNSMVMTWIVAGVIIFFAQAATKKMALVPAGLQNFAEAIVEGLYNFLEGILGAHLVKRTFWFFGGLFFLILFTNWAGLIPGVGTVGLAQDKPGDSFIPFLRGANADLNQTAAMAMTFAVLWFYWAFSENGAGGFFGHIFSPKGQFGGLMKIFMIVVFGAVGILELISIAVRPVALSFRLFGNIFAGENVLESMQMVVPKWLMWLPPLPFYFMELLVGLIQAVVFTLLTSVFLKLICEHHDEEHSEGSHH
ncbi:F0F1 ATP synthase subunit A [Luteolibacter flavescens]|uniref:ATP synthase subunit a n=1 Tax=Luteolibacter flavescens TaxID=1859460 RepID=A0ABT3FK75_9BACT|nr:F0F1 ATP synthase subunit A [Luteolibacter flavescens]MCW1883940.1 F0F1 ATP synthase subunit A [Luteolibacter flavescens]